jgi:hypothetical protein
VESRQCPACLENSACGISFGKGVVWSVIWPAYWVRPGSASISEATDPPVFPAKWLFSCCDGCARTGYPARSPTMASLSSRGCLRGASHRASHIPAPSAAPAVSPRIKMIGGPEGTKVFSAATNDCPMTSLTVSSSGGPSRKAVRRFCRVSSLVRART